ncbi:beta-ketoacyl synthase N-terminal-like domain-containing protein [Pseudovibrio sp. WM33]|uniref:beta-ketoacyl synthase N-terminal-like domain-containing protein n=1 Tax=Pseudovibrio sp. WM33 TaxID=1735585 RepID=UPI0007AE41FB|nr:beta-ketoacyl synthase N-terminal-like domain-containing protein [Pseudovibrio sp. WM33]KZL23794.1 Actinorhodin polyketide putative beta-ketoacyl synthase 1 [Pseudovibrio sp. WM33]
MTRLYIENAAAVGPLGANLEEIWSAVLAGKTSFGQVNLPGNRAFCAAETKPGTGSDIAAYAPLYNDAIRGLVADLQITEPVDAIFFATAVGNLGQVENKVYSKAQVSLDDLDFSKVEEVFKETAAWGPETRFVSVPTGCCAGLQATGLAKTTMARMGLKRAVIMSLDFGLTPLALEAFSKINATTAFAHGINASPSRPFCQNRDGFLFADGGGAILITTEPSDAPMPCISGYGCVSSAYHMTDIATDGDAIRRSIELALDQSGLTGGDIGHVNLHASGTQQNDEAEYNALRATIGEVLPAITAFKGNHGHALGGANMIELALSWKMLREATVPPSPAHLPVDAYEAVPPREQPEPLDRFSILKTASGFSGIHATVIMEA